MAWARIARAQKRTLGLLDQVLATRTFAAGENFTIADIVHSGRLWQREFAGDDFEDTPHVGCWYAGMEARPAIRRAIEKVSARVP